MTVIIVWYINFQEHDDDYDDDDDDGDGGTV